MQVHFVLCDRLRVPLRFNLRRETEGGWKGRFTLTPTITWGIDSQGLQAGLVCSRCVDWGAVGCVLRDFNSLHFIPFSKKEKSQVRAIPPIYKQGLVLVECVLRPRGGVDSRTGPVNRLVIRRDDESGQAHRNMKWPFPAKIPPGHWQHAMRSIYLDPNGFWLLRTVGEVLLVENVRGREKQGSNGLQ